MSILDTTVNLLIIGGIGYFAYNWYNTGLCSGFLGKTPVCAGLGAVDFFKQQYNTGDAGKPFELEPCSSGYTDFGLTCTRCMSISDCFSGNGCGCNTVGKLDHQQCPNDHPDKVGLLCYKRCPKGWIHTEAMPYLCRNAESGNFWDFTGGRMFNAYKDNFMGWFNFGSKLI